MHPDLHQVAEQRIHELHAEATMRRRATACPREHRIRAAIGRTLVRAGERLASAPQPARRTAVSQ